MLRYFAGFRYIRSCRNSTVSDEQIVAIEKKLLKIVKLSEAIATLQLKVSELQQERADLMNQVEIQYEEAAKAAEPLSTKEREALLNGSVPPEEPKATSIPEGAFKSAKAAPSLIETAEQVARLVGPVDAVRLSAEMAISFDAARLRLARAAKAGLLKRIAFGQYEANPPLEDKDIEF
jgi:hypothetical protein